ncbi:hypothetical protein M5X00_26470 [Paenibacillus alvei]|uniref:hypothetical protein n=1 Tax=Paenibacillus alvei TaxID=44250 RepID=UPI0002890B6B|nr:hypothetical protein [Paenibacillus alvei]EJW14048.1 hypothetical protein PAV_141p01540 [Paenibacillus alvei DSM 29]MCY9544897.1 hypothetical protein [Paenibacillus alvei]MCY9707798.1 hypothetical protein [Paenibacillus alvei]MCY9757778.1 hypothetical protein [Paenibacillus alvei]MEC0082689.1 hypothetical protein [Paenibacillus alvei]
MNRSGIKLTSKEIFIGTVSVAMRESGYNISQINEICSNIIGILEFSNTVEVMRKANNILHECLLLSNDIKTS